MFFTHAYTLSHTNTFTHRHFYTQTLLHTDTVTHGRLYTQRLLHTDTFKQTKTSIAIFPQVLTSNVHFVLVCRASLS